MSIMAALTEICCHTCRFNPRDRADTMVQILKPCTLSFFVSDQNAGNTLWATLEFGGL